ncbi:MAG: DegV family protein [Actinobacteria bacterium]|nr:DegV family protein [Actinomycetota bacterium]
MQKVAIVTDSTADIQEDLIKKHHITLVPLSVIFEEKAYLDNGIDLTNEEFYRKLKEAKKLPTTAQPAPADFKKVYSKLLEDYESIISIHISSKMSGTIDSAQMAKKEMTNKNIEIIDSEVTTIALGLIVLKAVEMAESGASKEEVLNAVSHLKNTINTLFIPTTLEYLQKGGRIGRAKGLIASLLEIKPVLTLHKGEVSQYKTTRRWNQAKNELISSMHSMVRDERSVIVSVADADLKEEGDAIAERIKSEFSPALILRAKIGCIVGTHLGPGLAIAFYEQ